MSSVLETVQSDFVGRLMADAGFSDVAVFAQRKALTVSEVNQLLKTLKGRSGKVGTCIVVQLPGMDLVDPDLPGPRTAIVESLLVIEHPTINASSQGTGKTAEQLSIAALQLFHHWTPFGVTQVWTGDPRAIVPAPDLDGLNAYVVTFRTLVALAAPARVTRPTIAVAPATAPTTVTLTCATSGAAISYTLDNSYPSSANAAAILYTAPFALATTATIRAAASFAGSQQSDIAQLTVN